MLYSKYLLTLRMEIAGHMLRDTALPVSSIATAVGISHAKNFSRTFRKHYGMSAVEYRQQNCGHSS